MTVTAAAGFRAAGVAAGIGSPALLDPALLDLAMVVNDGPSFAAAGVFSLDQDPAAPVLWSRQVLTGGRLRAAVLNAGGANARTGPEGFQTTHATAEAVGAALDCGAGEVAVCSTGPVGTQLPRERVLAGVERAASALADSPGAGTDAATAVTVSPARPAQALYRDAAGWLVGGFAAGAPAETLLAVLTTDAEVPAEDLDTALRSATERTFAAWESDGGATENDTVLVLASGASGVRPGRAALDIALAQVCAELAGLPRVAPATDDSNPADPDRAGDTATTLDPPGLEIAINGELLCRNGQALDAGPRTTHLPGPETSAEIGPGAGGVGSVMRSRVPAQGGCA